MTYFILIYRTSRSERFHSLILKGNMRQCSRSLDAARPGCSFALIGCPAHQRHWVPPFRRLLRSVCACALLPQRHSVELNLRPESRGGASPSCERHFSCTYSLILSSPKCRHTHSTMFFCTPLFAHHFNVFELFWG